MNIIVNLLIGIISLLVAGDTFRCWYINRKQVDLISTVMLLIAGIVSIVTAIGVAATS
jgi:hypothetical protein